MSGKKKNPLPPFVPLTWDLLNSVAYRGLKSSAVKSLPFFIGKGRNSRNMHCNLHSAPFKLSYSELQKKTGLSRTGVSDAVRDLIAKGFVDILERGYRTDYGGRHSSTYAISHRWRSYGEPHFEEVDLDKVEPKTV